MANIREFLKSAEQMEQIRKELGRSLSVTDHLTKSFDGIARLGESLAMSQKAMIALGEASKPWESLAASLAMPASLASHSLAAAIEATRPPLKLSKLMGAASLDWQRSFAAIEASNLQSLAPIQTHFAKLYEISKITDFALRGFKIEDIGGKLGLDAFARSALADVHVAFGNEYTSFFESIAADESALVSYPKPLTELPAVEYLNQSALVAATSEVEVDADVKQASLEVQREYATDDDDQLTDLLTGLDPDLPPMLSGARAVLETKHPDYVRHFAASLRELFTHVLHQLAPDTALKAWTNSADDYHNGRPTRRARLRYITRDVQNLFGGFLNADVDAALKFLDAFQKGTHAIRPDFSEQEVLELRVRMEGLIRFLLVVNANR